MNRDEREKLFVPGTRDYKKPIAVVVQGAERRTTMRRDGNHDENVLLTYDHPLRWHDGGHTHNIPWAALADRALQYELDPDSDTFLVDVIEHIIYERHHDDAVDTGLLPKGVTAKIRRTFAIDRKSIEQHATSQVDLAWVKQHIADFQRAAASEVSQLPAHVIHTNKLDPEDLTKLSPQELLGLRVFAAPE